MTFVQQIKPFSKKPTFKHSQKHIWLELDMGDFLGGPVVKTSPSNAGGEGSIPGRELRSHMPHGQKTKTQNRSNLVKIQ